jgi:peptidoglycan/xylan/chitin deacetylase (PgdA/CDA1 family)
MQNSGGTYDNRCMGRVWLVSGLLFGLGAAVTLGAGPGPLGARASQPAGRQTAAQAWRLKPHPTVALTFDDLPAAGGLSPDDTRLRIASTLAAELKAHHIIGVYGFVTAEDLEGDTDSQQALRAWVDAGMSIGNHTWSHPSLNDVTAAAFEQQIALDEPALRQYAGKRDWHWFRYPYLEEGGTPEKRDDVLGWLHAHGYRIADVTLNFEDDDWSDPYGRCLAQHNQAGIEWLKQSYIENAAEFIRLGREEEIMAFGHEIPNVLLLHETAFTTLMLPRLLDLLHREGFRYAPLPKVEKDPAYAVDPGVGSPEGGPLPYQVLMARHLKLPPFTPEPVERLNSLCRQPAAP